MLLLVKRRPCDLTNTVEVLAKARELMRELYYTAVSCHPCQSVTSESVSPHPAELCGKASGRLLQPQRALHQLRPLPTDARLGEGAGDGTGEDVDEDGSEAKGKGVRARRLETTDLIVLTDVLQEHRRLMHVLGAHSSHCGRLRARTRHRTAIGLQLLA